jgi:hypothetical protein
MPQDPIGFLTAFIDFAETDAIFILPHLDAVVGRLCEVTTDADAAVHSRNFAMLSFSAMASGAVEMCQCSREFYERVFEVLIHISAQVPEEDADDDDTDDAPPCRLALKHFLFLSYPRTIYLCKHPFRFSLIDRSGFDNQFLIPLALTFSFTS